MAKTKPDTVMDPVEQPETTAEEAVAPPAPPVLDDETEALDPAPPITQAIDELGPNPTLGEILEYEARKHAS